MTAKNDHLAVKKLLRKLAIVALAILLALLVATGMQVDDWGRDLTSNRSETRPDNRDPLLRPLLVNATLDEISLAASEFAHERSNWRITQEQELDAGLQISMERTTRLLRFVDDVLLTASRVDAAVRIDVVSQSRVGKGDLGQNPRNVRELIGRMGERLSVVDAEPRE